MVLQKEPSMRLSSPAGESSLPMTPRPSPTKGSCRGQFSYQEMEEDGLVLLANRTSSTEDDEVELGADNCAERGSQSVKRNLQRSNECLRTVGIVLLIVLVVSLAVAVFLGLRIRKTRRRSEALEGTATIFTPSTPTPLIPSFDPSALPTQVSTILFAPVESTTPSVDGQPVNGCWSETEGTEPPLTVIPTLTSVESTSPTCSSTQPTQGDVGFSSPSSTPTISMAVSTMMPTLSPSFAATLPPSLMPTSVPQMPTVPLSLPPTYKPSKIPALQPTLPPTSLPSLIPTFAPQMPTVPPFLPPTSKPSKMPTLQPSLPPTSLPSEAPTRAALEMPSDAPSTVLSTQPSVYVDPITTFYAIGDVPYSDTQAAQLTLQINNLPLDAEFVIHVGDLRNAGNSNPECRLSEYEDVSRILQRSHAPVFVILGDNDWTDCRNRNQGFSFWNSVFNGFESKHWKHSFVIQRQPGRTENFSFVHKGTLFLGLNLVGGDVHNGNEWATRLTEQVTWTKELILTYNHTQTGTGRVVVFGHANPHSGHERYFRPLTQFIDTELFNKLPILYLNGDKHVWSYDPSFRGQESWLRIMISGGTTDPPLKVSVHADGDDVPTDEAFTYNRRL